MKKTHVNAGGAAKQLGAPSTKPGQWVQTERKAHEAWASLIARNARAAQMLHQLVAHMGSKNAVVISQKSLAALMGCSLRTVQYAAKALAEENWVQIVKLGGAGTVAAYVVNSRIAWGQARDHLGMSVFDANIVASIDDQDVDQLENGADLRKIPTLYPGERQLPAGPGEPPPSQPSLDGLEPELPSLQMPGAD